MHISYLAPDEARDLIEHPVPGFEAYMQYEVPAREAIVRLTRGQPFLVQLICAELVDLLNREHRRVANGSRCECGLGSGPGARRRLFRPSCGSTRRRGSEKFCARWPQAHSRPTDERILAALCRRELLEPADGGFRFQVPLVAQWVRNRALYPDAIGTGTSCE